jgi:hypothetical protein
MPDMRAEKQRSLHTNSPSRLSGFKQNRERMVRKNNKVSNFTNIQFRGSKAPACGQMSIAKLMAHPPPPPNAMLQIGKRFFFIL